MKNDVVIQNAGALIRDERIAGGLTQQELGEKIGVGKARISKIESGRGLTVATVQKVLSALNLSASIVARPADTHADKRIIGYIVASISEFAKAHSLTPRDACNYLQRFRGLEFLSLHYEAEHLLSFDDTVADLTRVCHNNGGGLR